MILVIVVAIVATATGSLIGTEVAIRNHRKRMDAIFGKELK